MKTSLLLDMLLDICYMSKVSQVGFHSTGHILK